MPRADLPMETLAARYAVGVSTTELAEEYGVHQSTVSKRLREYGVRMRPADGSTRRKRAPDKPVRKPERKPQRAKGPRAAKVYLTEEACARQGCSQPALGDEWCSTECYRLDHGVPLTGSVPHRHDISASARLAARSR